MIRYLLVPASFLASTFELSGSPTTTEGLIEHFGAWAVMVMVFGWYATTTEKNHAQQRRDHLEAESQQRKEFLEAAIRQRLDYTESLTKIVGMVQPMIDSQLRLTEVTVAHINRAEGHWRKEDAAALDNGR